MNFFKRIKLFFLNLKDQKIEGYICTDESSIYWAKIDAAKEEAAAQLEKNGNPEEPVTPNYAVDMNGDPILDNNTEVIKKFGVIAIKFKIPFLDKRNHWVDCYFIPKQAQEDLFFLNKLIRNIPMIAIFRRRRFIGFPKSQYEVIELWSSNAYREIQWEQNQYSWEEDWAITQEEELRAQEVAKKRADQLAKKAAEKEAKRQERERIKQEKKLEMQLEREAKKLGISVEKLKKQKEKEAKQAASAEETVDEA